MSARRVQKLKRRLSRKLSTKMRRDGCDESEISYTIKLKNHLADFLLKKTKGMKVGDINHYEAIREATIEFCNKEFEIVSEMEST